MNRIGKTVTALGIALALALPALAADERSGDITFSGGSVAAGVGYTWGSGTLHFQGKDIPFGIQGLSVVDVGLADIQGSGEVYNLTKVEDFPGNYVAAEAGATVGGGAAVGVLENQKGVRIYLHSTTQGLKLNLSTDGIQVSLK